MSWNKIQGHDRLIQSFQEVVRRGRLAHAYLFCGPAGVGKRLVATELAKALLCERVDAETKVEACDQCESCRLIEAGTHPDFFAVSRPEDVNEMPVESIRELCGRFSLKSARGRGKVAVLDDADDLNEESANCFLKTLEEPPPRSVLILIGADPQRQLPTIRSRCQLARFAPLPEELVMDLVRRQGIDKGPVLKRVARFAQGSPGLALELADEALDRFLREFLEALARPKSDTVALAKKFVGFVEDAGKETAPQRRRTLLVLHLILASLNEALILATGGSIAGLEPAEAAVLRNLIARAPVDKIAQLMARCLETETHVNRYIQLTLVIEGLVDALGQILDGPAPPR